MADNAELLKHLEKQVKVRYKCLTCTGFPTKEKTHFTQRNKSLPKHEKRGLTRSEKEDWIAKAIAAHAGGAEVERQQAQAEVQRIQAVQEEVQNNPGEDSSVYTLGFGSFKGKTVQHVMEKSPAYFAALVQQTPRGMEPFHDAPALKDSLIQAGLLDEIIAKGRAQKKEKEKATMAVEKSGEALSYHPEVRSLHNIHVKQSRECLGAELDLPEKTSVIPSGGAPLRSKRSRAFTGSKVRRISRISFPAPSRHN
jgi:hypothetical protein